jgi:hypothetical protein
MTKIHPSQIDNTIPQYVKHTLVAADMLNLLATPYELVAAPGANKVLLPYLIIAIARTTGNTPYTGSGDLSVLWGANDPFGGAPTIDGTAVLSTDDTLALSDTSGLSSATAPLLSDLSNQPLMLSKTGASEWAAGNAPVDIFVYYQILNVS